MALWLTLARQGRTHVLNGYRWPEGTDITMHLGFNGPPYPLQDGSASWNASATDAMRIWNQYIDTVKFVPSAA